MDSFEHVLVLEDGTAAPERPEWAPLEAVLPAAQCDGFRWMGRADADGQRVELYEHGITRRYLILDASGRVYRSTGDSGFERVELYEAIEDVFDGLT